VPSIKFGIFSLENFQDADLAKRFFDILLQHPLFMPDKYDSETIVKGYDFNKLDTSSIVKFWLNEESNLLRAHASYASGNLLMNKGKSQVSYIISWQKRNKRFFNNVTILIDTKFITKNEVFKDYFLLCEECINLFKPVKATIINETFPEWREPINLRVIYPELHWIEYFGRPYIDLFGREKLLAAPCYNAREVNEDRIALQLTESPFFPIPESTRSELKNYLGHRAFVESGKSYIDYQDSPGIVPVFDFSKVLFDKNQPIEEDTILKLERS